MIYTKELKRYHTLDRHHLEAKSIMFVTPKKKVTVVYNASIHYGSIFILIFTYAGWLRRRADLCRVARRSLFVLHLVLFFSFVAFSSLLRFLLFYCFHISLGLISPVSYSYILRLIDFLISSCSLFLPVTFSFFLSFLHLFLSF